jgi:hypothetical protein
MSQQRRRRWFRRLAIGLAFATFAAPAAAKYDEGSAPAQHVVTAGGWSGAVDPQTGVPLSAGISEAYPTAGATPSRPDDVADRFAHSELVSGGSQQLASSVRGEWDEGLALAIGAVVLALGLGLALGYIGRPRLARTS